uniref:uncharacterized protein LOC118554676 isoform X2 n=1 Tax=Halichoerus grypus TaxID=9711 RepID=UPI001658DFB8|nr:uncharacterized protein LOC118554676 isoform X2 [Halichoerus grypus]XP_035978304.1 uncharacterized protein LOC118554676 isoform X2 [Halichoerus grypus]
MQLTVSSFMVPLTNLCLPHILPGTLPLTVSSVEKALPSPLSSGTQVPDSQYCLLFSFLSGITESCLLSTYDEWASPVHLPPSLSARPVGTNHSHSTDTCRCCILRMTLTNWSVLQRGGSDLMLPEAGRALTSIKNLTERLCLVRGSFSHIRESGVLQLLRDLLRDPVQEAPPSRSCSGFLGAYRRIASALAERLLYLQACHLHSRKKKKKGLKEAEAPRDEMYTKAVLHHANCNFLNHWCLMSDPWAGTSSIRVPWELVRNAKAQAHPRPTGILRHTQPQQGALPLKRLFPQLAPWNEGYRHRLQPNLNGLVVRATK